MSDYLAQVKIKNGRIWSLMKEHDIKSQAELARLAGLGPSEIGAIMNFKNSPMLKSGEWRSSVLKIADVFGVLPDEMFSPEQLMLEVETNHRDYLISHDEVMLLADQREAHLSLAEDEKDAEMMRDLIEATLEMLTPREKAVIELRYGIGSGGEHTLSEVGDLLDISSERVRQLEYKALRKLRNPKLSFNLLTAQGDAPPSWLVARPNTVCASARARVAAAKEDANDEHPG